MFFSLPAAADTSPHPFYHKYIGLLFIVIMFSINYVINLFLFVGFFLLFASMMRRNVGELNPNPGGFMLRVLVGTAIITLFGLPIDLAFVPPYGIVISNWIIALIFIFASIYLAAHYFVKIGKSVSMLIGIGMVAANLASWVSIYYDAYPLFLPLMMLAMLPLLLIFLNIWHRTVLTAG